MAFVELLLLAATLPQAGAGPSLAEGRIRADAVFQRAWQGRHNAVQRLCGERSRLVRVQALDTRFARMQLAYQQRFGAAWNGQALVGEGRIGMNRVAVKGVFSDQGGVDAYCVSATAFAGALGEYQNGIMLAEAELGTR